MNYVSIKVDLDYGILSLWNYVYTLINICTKKVIKQELYITFLEIFILRKGGNIYPKEGKRCHELIVNLYQKCLGPFGQWTV